jgi:nitroreductase
MIKPILSILALPLEYFRDWLNVIKWGKGSPLAPRERTLYYDIILLAHTVEKGLSMPNPRPNFGIAKIVQLLEFCAEYGWNREMFPIQMSYGALKEYADLHQQKQAGLGDLQKPIETFLSECRSHGISEAGGTRTADLVDSTSHSGFLTSRWSCRRYKDEIVDPAVVSKIVKCAQSAPSQCNRQSVKIHVYSKKEQIQNLLKLQGGSAGFADGVRNLFVVTSEMAAWSGAKPRNQAFVDGGLFAMQLAMSCLAHELGCCMLNLAVTNGRESEIKTAGSISHGERLVVMIAFGVPAEDGRFCARSERIPLESVLISH